MFNAAAVGAAVVATGLSGVVVEADDADDATTPMIVPITARTTAPPMNSGALDFLIWMSSSSL